MKFFKKYLLSLLGVLLLIVSITSLTVLTQPTFKEQTVTFNSSYKEKDVKLKGSYYEVKDSKYAVLICPGYSCDRQKWKVFASLFVKNGYSTMMFDYSGQGASYGTIGFDNAKTDAIPIQIDDAVEKLHELSGIAYENIILVGHSMGGRSIMRLIYDYNDSNAETTISYKPIKNVIVMSPEINYEYNAQASLFAGTKDSEEYPWKDYSASSISGVNVYIFGSTADDVVSEGDCISLYNRLGGNITTYGKVDETKINAEGSRIYVGVTSGILHSYIMYSKTFAAYCNTALFYITGNKTVFNANLFILVYVGWFTTLAGVFLVLFGLNRNECYELNDINMELIDCKKYLLRKLLMWIPGIIVAFIICCLLMVLPWGSPIMNTPYMCFIAGYGITMLIHYRKGIFKGTKGKLPKLSFKAKIDTKSLLIMLGVIIGVIGSVWYVLNQTMYRLLPFNTRLLYLLFATLIMTISYYISGVESDMLKKNKATKLQIFFYNLVQYVPLFLFVIFYAAIGSFSGFIGQMQNMVLMYILCIPVGEYIKKKTNNRLYGALTTAFLFQTLMITSAALISFF